MAAGARLPRRAASRSEQFQLGFGFHIEKADAGAQGFANFLARFAHAGKDHAVSGNAGALQAVSSPPETMSNPLPSPASSRRMERFALALTE